MNEELYQHFLDFGALGYSDDKIRSILNCTITELSSMKKDGGEKAYLTGADKFQFAVEKKLMELAVKGDLNAVKKLEQNKRMNSRVK